MIPFAVPVPAGDEERAVHHAMLRIVAEVGMRVEHPGLVDRLAAAGGQVRPGDRVTFAPDGVETFLAESEKRDWTAVSPDVGGGLGIYGGQYLDPETDDFLPYTPERLETCFKVAKCLAHVTSIQLQNCPLAGVGRLEPLYARLFAARAGGGCASIMDTSLCPYIEEFTHILAEARGVSPARSFAGGVYLISPLRFARHPAEQFMYFAERGYRPYVGHMASAGGTAPVTLAGSMALHLAEAVFIHIVNRTLFGDRSLGFGSSISVLDMKTGIYPYGRPEMALTNVAMARMARFYGASFSGHCGLTDAKRPSAEAGAQKMLTAIPTLMACGSAHVDAGTLSIDEVQSPIQMIIDDECIGALKRFAAGVEINDETLAVEVVKAVGPGGTFLDTEHTLQHFRSEHWQPTLWAREMYDGWQRAGSPLDVDRARQRFRGIMAEPDPGPSISPETEARLRGVIARAKQSLG